METNGLRGHGVRAEGVERAGCRRPPMCSWWESCDCPSLCQGRRLDSIQR